MNENFRQVFPGGFFFSPDGSGIFLWQGLPQKIQRTAGIAS